MQHNLNTMKTTNKTQPTKLPYLLLSLLLTLPLLLLVLRLRHGNSLPWNTPPNTNYLHPKPKPKPKPEPETSITARDIRIRPGFTSYEAYIRRQVNKTLNPHLRHVWTTRDWDRKILVFSAFFRSLQQRRLLSNISKSLCIGARVGQEVEALRRIGVSDSVGIDLVPYPPLVIRGDFHRQPFKNDTFDFEFSNVFDHAIFPGKFVGEIERTLKSGGVCVLHVAVKRRTDKYSANDLFSIAPLVEMFRRSDLVEANEVDGFGANTEVVFRKREKEEAPNSAVLMD